MVALAWKVWSFALLLVFLSCNTVEGGSRLATKSQAREADEWAHHKCGKLRGHGHVCSEHDFATQRLGQHGLQYPTKVNSLPNGGQKELELIVHGRQKQRPEEEIDPISKHKWLEHKRNYERKYRDKVYPQPMPSWMQQEAVYWNLQDHRLDDYDALQGREFYKHTLMSSKVNPVGMGWMHTKHGLNVIGGNGDGEDVMVAVDNEYFK